VSQFRFGPVRYYVLTHPDAVRHVLRDRAANYSKDMLDYRLIKCVMGESLLTGEGEFWQRQRRLIQPAFQRKQLGILEGRTTASVADMLAAWESACDGDRPIDIAAEMTRLTLRIIGLTLFGTDLTGEARAVGDAVGVLNAAGTWGWDAIRSQIPVLNRRFKRALAMLDGVVHGLIAGHRLHPDRHADLLSALLQARDEATGEAMPDAQVRNEVMTLLLAGHETTAGLLAWTFYLLATNADAGLKLRAELAEQLGGRPPELADLPRLTYTRMVIEESMRLYPPIWVIPRAAVADDEVGGFPIPRGAYVLVCPYVTHRDPAWWDAPDEFRPERFAPGADMGRPAFAFFPFGGGQRLCVGAHFATAEAQLVVAAVAQRFGMELAPGHVVRPAGHLTLRPMNGVVVRLTPPSR
jgi:cytochrome P450